MRDPKFRLLDMPESHEERVILFPRTCLSRNEPYTRVSSIGLVGPQVRVTVAEHFNEGSHRQVSYDFDLSLRPTKAFLSSNYREEHLKLEASGLIKHSWRDDEAGLAKGLEYRSAAP